MNILIYGFGRMGLTHYSILNALNPDLEFTLIEPNKVLLLLLKSNLNCEVLKDDTSLKDSFDLTLITTPPFLHQDFLKNSLIRGDKKIFIEKPFGGHTNIKTNTISENVFIGYVLRFNPCIQWVKKNINPDDIVSVKAQYLSNTIEKKPQGWRNGAFSGVLSEMGSHVIDLVNYLVNIDDYHVIRTRKESVVSDVDDIVETKILSKGREVSFYLNWVKKDVRKPVFGLEFELKSGKRITVDQQTISFFEDYDFQEKISVTDLAKKVPYYLRGIDFTKQMEDLLGEPRTLCNMNEALKVNEIMKKVLEK